MTTEQRIEHLETKCNRLSFALTGMTLLSLAILCVAAKPNDVKDNVQAKKLEIVDDDGKVRIRLGPADAGYGLVVYDEDGQFRATLTDAPQGAVSQLRKAGGSIKMMAMEGGCGITIRDQDGKPRVLMLQQQEGSQIMLKDAEGKAVFSAPD
tara:strand:+ start:511 stop:966 length:456 start_codon:yes stop_codon:yes gene_type:complete